MSKGHKHSEDLKDDVAAAIGSGVKPINAAVEFDISLPSVYSIMRERGVSLPNNKKEISPELAEEMVKAVTEEARSTAWVIGHYGITRTQFMQVMGAAGVDPAEARLKARRSDTNLAAAVELYKNGSPYAEIAEETHVNAVSLTQELHRLGIPLRRQRIATTKHNVLQGSESTG